MFVFHSDRLWWQAFWKVSHCCLWTKFRVFNCTHPELLSTCSHNWSQGQICSQYMKCCKKPSALQNPGAQLSKMHQIRVCFFLNICLLWFSSWKLGWWFSCITKGFCGDIVINAYESPHYHSHKSHRQGREEMKKFFKAVFEHCEKWDTVPHRAGTSKLNL